MEAQKPSSGQVVAYRQSMEEEEEEEEGKRGRGGVLTIENVRSNPHAL